MKLCRYLCAFALFLSIFCVGTLSANDKLTWSTNRIDADIEGWTLSQLLKDISTKAGWETYVEPGTTHNVSVKFNNLPMDEALRRLLGKLSFALIPQTNSSPKFYVFKTTMGQATELVQAPQETKAVKSDRHLIPNELIVTLKPNSKVSIDELAKLLGVVVIGRAEGLHAYRLRFASAEDANEARNALNGNSDVAAVDSNYRFNPPVPGLNVELSSTPQFSLTPTAVGDPNNLIVALIDSSVQQLGENMQPFLLPSIAVAEGSAPADSLSHGTSMAQSFLQALALADNESGSSHVKLLPVDVYGNRGNTTTYDVAYGIYQAVNNGAMIVNLSLGSSGDSTFLHSVIQSSAKQGVLFFAAAGNEPVTTDTYPAAYPEVIAVTAGDRKGSVASYANRGSFIDLMTPGTTLVRFNNQTYAVGGTSVATAFATGMAAGTADGSKKSFTDVTAALRAAFGYHPVK